MEAEDDGFVLVIVGNDEDLPHTNNPGSELDPTSVTIKQEPGEDLDSSLHVEELINTAKKHGEHIDVNNLPFLSEIKEEPFYCEYVEEEYLPEPQNDGGLSDDTSDTENESASYLKPIKNVRRKMVGPSERKSYVNQLRREHPDRLNTQALVQLLADTMKSVKPPPPPPDFYRVHDLNFECTECNRITMSLPAATRHYQEYHGPLYLKCFACGVDFRSPTNLYKHEKRCTAPDSMIVMQARALAVVRRVRNRPFIRPRSNEKNKKEKEINNQVFKCSQCPVEFRTKTALTSHTNLHRGERPYACDVCTAAYTRKSALKRHQELHKNNKYVCDHCHREFRMKVALQVHMDTHLPQRKFPCPYEGCGRRYAQNYALNIHINGRHKNLPPPCPCQICLKRFPRMSVLKVHMMKEHGMTLLTRNMLFKRLPKMSPEQVKQAKLVFNEGFDEGEDFDKGVIVLPEQEPDAILSDRYNTDVEIDDNLRLELLDNGRTEEEVEVVLTNVQKMLKKRSEEYSRGGNILVIEKGRVKNISKKSKFRKQYEKMIAEAREDGSTVEETSTTEL